MSLAGGTASLPITDPAARATPLAPSQWRAMLRDAVPLCGAAAGRSSDERESRPSVGEANNSARGGSSSSAATSLGVSTSLHSSAEVEVCEPRRPGYSSRPPLNADGAPASTASVSGHSWRSLGHGGSPPIGATVGGSPMRGSLSEQEQLLSASTAHGSAAAGEPVGCGDEAVRRRGVVVLDVRNGYEWDAGHFVGAERPAEVRSSVRRSRSVAAGSPDGHLPNINQTPASCCAETARMDAAPMSVAAAQDAFRETPTEATGAAIPAALTGVPADTPVMMYCTGGIRCDIYSTHLRKQGFTCGPQHPSPCHGTVYLCMAAFLAWSLVLDS